MTLDEIEQFLEEKLNKNQLMPRITEVYRSIPLLSNIPLQLEFIVLVLSQIGLYKRCDPATLVGLCYSFYKNAQKTIDGILVLVKLGLLDFDGMQFIVKVNLDAETEEEILRFCYPLPMVVEPETLKHNFMNGYKYVGNHSGLILRNNPDKQDINLDHLNRMNKVKLKLDKDVFNLMHNKNSKKIEDMSYAEKNNFIKFNARVEQFGKFYGELDGFYLTHKYDKRGRTYPQGYYLNYQGNDYAKAIIALADEELVQGD